MDAAQVRLQAMARVGMANAVGALLVFVYFWVLPSPGEAAGLHVSHDDVVSAWIFAGAMAIFMPAGFVLGSRLLRPVERWLAEERPPDDQERTITLAAPADWRRSRSSSGRPGPCCSPWSTWASAIQLASCSASSSARCSAG